MYLGYQNDKIKFYTDQELDVNLYNIDRIEETQDEYVLDGDEYVLKGSEWEGKETKRREKAFKDTFLATSLGNYRLQPKGYSNAQQSVDTINAMVNAIGSLSEQIAQMVIFYPTPDFTKEEQCTEEWLVEHQYTAQPMTKEVWTQFYIEFTTLYAHDQYKKENLTSNEN